MVLCCPFWSAAASISIHFFCMKRSSTNIFQNISFRISQKTCRFEMTLEVDKWWQTFNSSCCSFFNISDYNNSLLLHFSSPKSCSTAKCNYEISEFQNAPPQKKLAFSTSRPPRINDTSPTESQLIPHPLSNFVLSLCQEYCLMDCFWYSNSWPSSRS